MPFLLILLIIALVQPIRLLSHSADNHIVISEIQVSGAIASDEFVELFNPTDCPLSLAGWKLIKKTAGGTEYNLHSNLSGEVPAHGFFLITPQSGYDDTVAADATYSQTSNTIALDNAILLYADAAKTILVDKVGFADPGDVIDAEGSPAQNPSDHGSIERVGGIDTNNNGTDFVVRETADPQNRQSPPSSPGTCTAPPPPPPPNPSPPPSSPPPPIPGETVLTIAQARELVNGQIVSVSGIVTVKPGQLSGYYFYIQDETGGIQIYSSKKDFPPLTIGHRVQIAGETSEAYKEKRLKTAVAGDVAIVGNGSASARGIKTGEVNEENEGRLVILAGVVSQTSGDTFYIDDGSGEARIYIKSETAIDKPPMQKGDKVRITGIVSQYNDSYRVLPREQGDLIVGTTAEGDEEAGAGDGVAEARASSVSTGGEIVAEEEAIAGAREGPIFSTLRDTFRSQPRSLRVLGWSGIIVGGLLLLLLPLLIWIKRSEWLRIRLAKLRIFSKNSPDV